MYNVNCTKTPSYLIPVPPVTPPPTPPTPSPSVKPKPSLSNVKPNPSSVVKPSNSMKNVSSDATWNNENAGGNWWWRMIALLCGLVLIGMIGKRPMP
ncbi:hypothetical protein FDP41_003721 [Naegleria fowleri]|uniref:Uncharacterized protein n=1 Tax=Naegleria fowleri TaxID=5763 RepID=A0A6A5BSP2_NAEFO|nr:uncharacterized protein FDP41_003721 [Naegleria fowleri]KAF0977068.1 hypothetical protein FDP41_003721 [Naegleria fowleri]CAG4708707.1 unnamed protein product [Naegleria fowleri]